MTESLKMSVEKSASPECTCFKIPSLLYYFCGADVCIFIIFMYFMFFLCFVDRASRYNCVKKNQLDAQLSIFRQLLHVSGTSRPIIRRYNLHIQQLVLVIPFR